MATVVAASSKPALRLVSTKDLSRESWLEVRKRGIGSSDAAAAVGLNPYQSMLELWLVKTGRDEGLPKIDPKDETSPMYWGSLLEPIVAAHYTKRTGNRVRRINAVLQHPDPDKTWMLANLDYAVSGAPDVQILECKTAGEFGSRLWKEGVPEYVQLQVQHQLAVTNKQAADVCVLICGQEIRVHRIERDDALISRLSELERKFWHYVETDTPPPADGSDSAAMALQCLYPHDSGSTLDLAWAMRAKPSSRPAACLGSEAKMASASTRLHFSENNQNCCQLTRSFALEVAVFSSARNKTPLQFNRSLRPQSGLFPLPAPLVKVRRAAL